MSYVDSMKEKMENNISGFRNGIRSIRTGRANPALLDSVTLIYYGKSTPLNQVSNISVIAPRTLLIIPWDIKALKDIEQAVVKANLGVNPQNDGKNIRLILPDLTEERRKELVKKVKKMGEKCYIEIRACRRETMEEVKKAVKAKDMSEDEQKKLNDEIQKTTHLLTDKVEKLIQEKEKEIMEF
ncbi:MAG: ribosome recycling factor [Bdellovibrionales bacterium]|nr:ribosome recycling factor [Bdellovibrionales bacterium]